MNTNIEKLLNKVSKIEGIEALQKTGAEIYLVGGIIRDAFLGKESKDIDLLIRKLSIDEIKNILSPLGYVDVVGKSFGVLKFKPNNWSEDEPIDIALPRTEKKIGSGHHGFEINSDKDLSVEVDLKRRDITINSIAIRLDGKVVDPFNGLDDIKNKLIRATSTDSFTEDPLRMLRCVQFASRFDFDIESFTMSMIKEHSASISQISGERILTELDKIFFKGDHLKGFDTLNETTLFKSIFGFDLSIDKDLISRIKTREDFFYVLLSNDIKKRQLIFRDLLKGDEDTIKFFDALDISKTENKTLRHTIFLMHKKCKSSIDSGLISEELMSTAHEMITGKFPLTMSDLKINGNHLIQLGFKGKEIGDMLNKSLDAVFSEKIDNRTDSLLTFLVD